jgi:hypothetical protein
MIVSVTIDVATVKEDVVFNKNSLTRKVNVEEFVAAERRVALLERLTSKSV